MRLTVSTPTTVVENVDNLRHLRAEDATGAFGIMPGHTDFVAVLPACVVTWESEDGREGFVVVRQGVMTVRDGQTVGIAARGAFRADDLSTLEPKVLEELRRSDTEVDVARKSDTQLHLATMRQIEKVLRSGRDGRKGAPRLETIREPDDE